MIRNNHLKISNGAKKSDFENMPAIVYQGYSVHGNEASAATALLGLYYLAASNDTETLKILNNTVILFDPCLNPVDYKDLLR